MQLTRLFIQRPILLLVALTAIFILGFKALSGMSTELDPKVELPIINVMTIYPGAGPEEIERTVTRPIEDAASTVSNVTAVDSRSLQDVSFVTVRMKLGTDIDAVAADLRSRLDGIRRDLPQDIQNPQISKFDFNARPVMVLGVTGDRPLQELRRLVDEEIRPTLSGVQGLGNVGVVGGLEREVQVRVDPDRLAQYGLSLLDLLRPLQASSRSAPAGSVEQGNRDVTVRVLGEFSSLEELRNTTIPVAQNSMAQMSMLGGQAAMMGGAPRGPRAAPLRLGDFAEISDTTAEREQITRVGQRESIGLVLSRLSEANTVRVAEGVHRSLDELEGKLPQDVKITVLQDNSTRVADALEDINATLILGALLAVLVVFIFLHSLKDTLIVALSIPTCIVATFIVMYFAGFSLNQMTMLALSLSVGILVDDSILVLECIHRHRAMGKAPQEAALDGRQEIGLADAANTFVDVVVFIPIAFMAGVVGQFFKEFGLTIATATLASLYVSFTLTPTLAARWYRAGEPVEQTGRFARWFNRRYEGIEAWYRGVLAWSLRRRAVVVISGFGALALVGALAWNVLGFDFTPSVDRGEVSVRVELPPGASLQATDRLMQQVEAEAAKIPEVDAHRMLSSVGEIIGGFGSTPDRGPQFGQLTLMLMEKQSFVDRLLHPGGQPGRRTRSDEDVAADLRERLRSVPGGASATVSAMRGFTSASAPVQVSLFGNDLKELERVAEAVRTRMASVPQVQNVDTTLRRGKPEILVAYNREKAEDVFVTPAEVAGLMRTAISGNTDLRFRDGDLTVPIRLMVQRSGASNPARGAEALGGLLVARRGPSDVYVGDVADFRTGSGPTKILRTNRERRVSVNAHLRGNVSLGEAQRAVDAALRDVDMGGVRLQWEGEVDEMSESAVSMTTALLLATALSYLLLAAIFNSLVLPLAIMVSLPMALVGGLLGLIYTGTTMNIISMIGIVMLVGLVSKNAILLVDYTNTLRAKGLSREAALESAGPVRLRPILMTTISTVLAMTPVALQMGRASEMRAPMAIVVIGGLILSTLLTLLVIPVMYTYFDDLTVGVLRGWSRMFPQRASEAEVAPEPLATSSKSRTQD